MELSAQKRNVKFEYWFEDIDGENYSKRTENVPQPAPDVVDEINFVVGQTITYADIENAEHILKFTGFEYEIIVPETWTVLADSTRNVIKIQYTRNSYTLSLQLTRGVNTLTADKNQESQQDGVTTYSIKYEDTVALTLVINQGYYFSKWNV